MDGTPGEAVLTGGEANAVVAEAKVAREQVRAKNKESLLEIIDNDNLSDEQKQEAVNQMVQMTDLSEKEAAAVVVNAADLSDASRAQIEDIVTRKTGVAAQNIVITPVNTEGK